MDMNTHDYAEITHPPPIQKSYTAFRRGNCFESNSFAGGFSGNMNLPPTAQLAKLCELIVDFNAYSGMWK